jgi:hypothetical protein
MSDERVPYRIIITGSYNKGSEKACKKHIEDIIDQARGVLVNMGMKMSGKDGIADYNDVQIEQEDPRDVILGKWGVEDILERAKQRHIKLTKAKAREILHNVDNKMDAEIGINWDVIDCHTDMRYDN